MNSNLQFSQDKKSSDALAISKEIVTAFENLDMSEIRKVGPIFDGCGVSIAVYYRFFISKTKLIPDYLIEGFYIIRKHFERLPSS